MADVNRFSERLIDVAERFADVVESAQGRGARKNKGGAKWLILPAAGAAVYALATSSSSLARQTRQLMLRAKDRATDLPDTELLGRVKEATGLVEEGSSGSSAGTSTARRNQNRRSTSQTQRRRTSSPSR